MPAAPGTARILIRSLWQQRIKDKGPWDTWRWVAPDLPKFFVPTGPHLGLPPLPY